MDGCCAGWWNERLTGDMGAAATARMQQFLICLQRQPNSVAVKKS